ncbi:MAG: hypothetical protein HOO06_11650 [Bdellovibrionaceae bacterium]|jgi:hypothetical protein|nr:hypothetical protein [Pseudobdellovibrionaceae bacterium]
MKITLSLLVLSTLFFSTPIMAEDKILDIHSQKALQQTTELLNNAQQRENAISETQAGKDNHAAILKLNGGDKQNTDDIYQLSSQIFKDIVKKSNGDANKMQELLLEAQKNPEAFASSLSNSQKNQLRNISSDIEKSKPMSGH